MRNYTILRPLLCLLFLLIFLSGEGDALQMGCGLPPTFNSRSHSGRDSVTTSSLSVVEARSIATPWLSASVTKSIAMTLLTLSLPSFMLAAPPAFAVSGGGTGYSNLDISGKDFSGKSYKGVDFIQVIGKETNFRGR